MTLSREDAQKRADTLYRDLSAMVARDPEQEVQGMAVPVIEACIAAFREVAADDPVISRVPDLISPQAAEAGEPIREVDALVVVGQIVAVIGPVTPSVGGFAESRSPGAIRCRCG